MRILDKGDTKRAKMRCNTLLDNISHRENPNRAEISDTQTARVKIFIEDADFDIAIEAGADAIEQNKYLCKEQKGSRGGLSLSRRYAI
jgi:hypothetical protein